MNENRKKMLLWSLFTFTGISGLIMLDQLSKAFASSNLKNSDSVTVIKGFFDLTYVENRGAAWGVLSGRISILVIITVILIPIFDLILLLSGAVGNFIDRIIKGYVVDFFQFTFFDFPVFNVADCYITIGAVFFIVIYMFLLKDDDITILFKGEKAVLEEKRDDEISDKS